MQYWKCKECGEYTDENKYIVAEKDITKEDLINVYTDSHCYGCWGMIQATEEEENNI